MARLVSPALRAMLAKAVDYAGCFPPASLALPDAVNNYMEYRASPFAWMLGRFVIRHQDVAGAPCDLNGSLAVVGAQDHPRASAIETPAVAHFDKPTYCEVDIAKLPAVRDAQSFAKLRTGGVVPAAVPATNSVAAFITECARLRLPFKATAGLHHPIRSAQRLTYESESPLACMHGFVNMFFAVCWCWCGGDASLVAEILEETQPSAFRFDGAAHWRTHSLSVVQLEAARRDFLHSFGSCSFSEPVEELKGFGWL